MTQLYSRSGDLTSILWYFERKLGFDQQQSENVESSSMNDGHLSSKNCDFNIWGWVKTLSPLVNIKIAGKWMFIPLKMVLIGIDPYPCAAKDVFG
jgi:hypothetical protein